MSSDGATQKYAVCRRLLLSVGLLLSLNRATVATVPEYVEPSVSNAYKFPHRKTQEAERRSVLIVRILDATVGPEDSDTTAQLNENLYQTLFSGGESELYPSVKQQMMLCSAGQVILEPTSLGVITVPVTLPVDQYSNRTAWVLAAAELTITNHGFAASSTPWLRQLREAADHVILVLPDEFPDDTFLATAEIRNALSTYSLKWSNSLSAYMHELAHNFGVQHAAYASDVYGDTSGYMGRSNQSPWTPRKCFNAAQHWALGWYSDSQRRSITDYSRPQLIPVAAFVDWQLAAEMPVLLQLDDVNYLQFNRAKTYNSGTGLMEDRIVIVENGENDKTTLVAGLAQSESYQFLHENSYFVVVEVCDIVVGNDDAELDYAVISVGVGGSICGTYTRSDNVVDVFQVGTGVPMADPSRAPVAAPPTVPSTAPVAVSALPTSTIATTTPTGNAPTAPITPAAPIASPTGPTSTVPTVLMPTVTMAQQGSADNSTLLKVLLPIIALLVVAIAVVVVFRKCCRKGKVMCMGDGNDIEKNKSNTIWSSRLDHKHVVLQDNEDGDSLSVLFSPQRLKDRLQTYFATRRDNAAATSNESPSSRRPAFLHNAVTN